MDEIINFTLERLRADIARDQKAIDEALAAYYIFLDKLAVLPPCVTDEIKARLGISFHSSSSSGGVSS